MSLSSRGAAALVRRAKVAEGVPVTYTPAATGVGVALTVVPGATHYVTATDNGVQRLEISERDYQIAAADLAAAGIAGPALYDLITDTDPTTGGPLAFSVQDPENGEPAFRYASQSRALWRVHCKRVG